MKFALISDIHGNIAALEAVIESINGKGIKSVYNLGDSIYGPLWPNETAEYLRNSGIKTIIGNGDYDILNYPTKNKTLEINSNKLSDINKE
jgi:predicted phosphodiesterase